MKKVLIFGDDPLRLKNLTVEVKALADQMGASLLTAVVGPKAEQLGEEVATFGSELVFTVNLQESLFFAENIVENLFNIYNQEKPTAIFISSTLLGREIAPRLATKLKTGCITECAKVELMENGQLIAERLVYGGIAVSRMVIKQEPQIFATSFDTDEQPMEEGKYKGNIVKIDQVVSQFSKRIVSKARLEKSIDLAGAEKIVSVGRGFSGQEDIELVKPLLGLLNAELGCSRPVAEDFRWLPSERLVGLTGTSVKPKLYLAIGISGQIQHQVGMKNSKVIVAINNNPQAPIFDIADYGVVADLHEFLPKMIEVLQKGS